MISLRSRAKTRYLIPAALCSVVLAAGGGGTVTPVEASASASMQAPFASVARPWLAFQAVYVPGDVGIAFGNAAVRSFFATVGDVGLGIPEMGQAVGPGTVGAMSSSRRDILVSAAYAGLGRTYVWGGTSPFYGWDCSGFVQWAYAKAGISLPRTEQWLALIPTDRPQPGDLVVQNPDGPAHWSHVGIYVGDGIMISALNPSVGTVRLPVALTESRGTSRYFTIAGGEAETAPLPAQFPTLPPAIIKGTTTSKAPALTPALKPAPKPAPKVDPRPSPTPFPDPSPSPTPSPTPGPTPSPIPEPSPTPSPIPEPSPTPSPTPEPSPTPSPIPEPSPSPSPEPSPNPDPTPSPSPSPEPTSPPPGDPTPTPAPTLPAPAPSAADLLGVFAAVQTEQDVPAEYPDRMRADTIRHLGSVRGIDYFVAQGTGELEFFGVENGHIVRAGSTGLADFAGKGLTLPGAHGKATIRLVPDGWTDTTGWRAVTANLLVH